MAMVATLFGPVDAGSYAQGPERRLTLVNLAIEHGMPVDWLHLVIVAACWANVEDGESWAQLADMADDAISYLNSVTRHAYIWAWVDDELVMEKRP